MASKKWKRVGRNMCRDMDADISRRSSGWEATITIKDVPKAKRDKSLRDNLFNSDIFSAMLYVSKTLATTKEEQSLHTMPLAMERPILEI